MNDRELLELAAKACGVAFDPKHSMPHPTSGAWWGLWIKYDREPSEYDRRYWNPLTDDGDRYRLIAALKMSADFDECTVWKRLPNGALLQEWWGGECDLEAYAVLRVAAEIGKALP